MKLLYPTSLKLDTREIEGFPVSLHAYNVTEPIPADLIDAEILVTWCNASGNIKDAAARMHNLRWIQSLAAGPNDVLDAGFDTATVTITSGSGLHSNTVSEHALGLLLNAARCFYEMRDLQLQGHWAQHLGYAQPDRPAGRFTTLRDANIVIWGFGDIAKALAVHLTALGSNIKGVARHAGVRNGIEIFTDRDLPVLLRSADALVMILPGSDETQHALNRERLALLQKHAWVVNVGRGTSIDEDALADALEQETIGGAALDVFETEPLPKSSRLWKAPNLIISPHAAGGRPQGSEALIARNLRRFLAGQLLENTLSAPRK